MNFFKPNIIYVMAAIVAVVAVMVLFAEPVFSQPPPPPEKPEQVPLGGLALLAVAGGGYAIKKLRDRRD